jgi:hypothetical protein
MLNVLYVLLGAKVALSSQLSVLLRELDLVQVGARTTLDAAVVARMFHAPKRHLSFRGVIIGADYQLGEEGVVCPAAGLPTARCCCPPLLAEGWSRGPS